MRSPEMGMRPIAEKKKEHGRNWRTRKERIKNEEFLNI
jgi:hypothetical protein